MKKLLLVTLLFFAFPAYADEGEQGIKVDLDKVVASGKVAPVGGITSAGQPDTAALEVFAESGYAAVIDMRGLNEDRGISNYADVVEGKGMEYIAFPISSAAEINLDKARQLDELLADIDGPVLLHCGSGNRVGAVLALRESLNGADDEAAIEFGKDAGLTRLEPVVREALEAD
ncbi:MAG: sulfur transferase domain-containing protein [Woeseiaceae bacterium]|nr:sulfur transferase domain-containing protein [Woeseiaceae bacterium]